MFSPDPPFFTTAKRCLYAGLAGLAAALGACGKEAAPPLVPDANTALLAAHPWRIVAYTATNNGIQPPQTEDWYAALAAHRKDDNYRFNADNSLVFDEGAQKQNAGDPQSTSGRWQFTTNQTGLIITLGKTVPLGTTGITNSTTYTIRELRSTALRLQGGTPAQTVAIPRSH